MLSLIEDNDMKICSKCREKKSYKEFHRDRTHSDGFKASCKGCRSANNTKKPTSKNQPTSEQNEILREAQRIAVGRLIEAHKDEFRFLVAGKLRELGFKPQWRQVS